MATLRSACVTPITSRSAKSSRLASRTQVIGPALLKRDAATSPVAVRPSRLLQLAAQPAPFSPPFLLAMRGHSFAPLRREQDEVQDASHQDPRWLDAQLASHRASHRPLDTSSARTARRIRRNSSAPLCED